MSDDPNVRKVAIVPIRKPLADLLLENKTYYNGQFITAIDDLGRQGIKVGDWKWLEEDISAGTTFVDLPWIVAPESAGTSGYTPFKVRPTDPTGYAVVGGNTVITDLRLKGVADPVVTNTATGVEFRDEDLEIDSVAGTITILGFAGLEATEHITVYVPNQIKTAGSLEDLEARVTKLETIASASIAGGLMFWINPIADIPAGWRICSTMAGLFPVARKTGDVDFGGAPGTLAGSSAFSIAAGNLPKIIIDLPTNDANIVAGGLGKYVGTGQTSAVVAHTSFGNDVPAPIKNIPSAIVGVWIELIPV